MKPIKKTISLVNIIKRQQMTKLLKFLEKDTKSRTIKAEKRILESDDLFHQFNESPIKIVAELSTIIEESGVCPTCVKDEDIYLFQAKSLEERQRMTKCPQYYCLHCGLPTHCSKEHYDMDIENHLLLCPTLKQYNEDLHDLKSNRKFPEFNFPCIPTV